MDTNISYLIEEILNVNDNERTDPRIGLRQLREQCVLALDAIAGVNNLSNEQQQLQSTIWVIDSVTREEASFDRWLLFVLRSKKKNCVDLLRKFLVRHPLRIAA